MISELRVGHPGLSEMSNSEEIQVTVLGKCTTLKGKCVKLNAEEALLGFCPGPTLKTYTLGRLPSQ